MSTAAQDNVRIDISGNDQETFNQLLNRADQVNQKQLLYLIVKLVKLITCFRCQVPQLVILTPRTREFQHLKLTLNHLRKSKYKNFYANISIEKFSHEIKNPI